jgi:hypothetical protein
MRERGATSQEVIATVTEGRSTPAKHRRVAFKRTFHYRAQWLGVYYARKRVIAYVKNLKSGNQIVVTVVVQYFQ